MRGPIIGLTPGIEFPNEARWGFDVTTQGGRKLKNIEMDFKFRLTRKHKHNISDTQLRQTGNSPGKFNISFIPVNPRQVLHLSFQAFFFVFFRPD